MARNAADILVDALIEAEIPVVFGLPGDGINGIMEALRLRQEKIRFIQVRHEESAAFMAVAYAKWTGRMACCLATSGPGGVHLLNGLYDGKFDQVPVLALTGMPYHDLIDTSTQQDIDQDKLFADVAVYSSRVMSVHHVENTVALACRAAYGRRGVAHLSIPVDVQEQTRDDVEPSERNRQHRVRIGYDRVECRPPAEQIARAAEILNAGKRVCILAGQGALAARQELLETASRLGAPIVKALLGKAVIPDDHPMTTGGIGLFGTPSSQAAMQQCDTLLIVGSTFPYLEYYPKPDQARGVQIDVDATRIGLRFPVEVGLAGDAALTLKMLNEKLRRSDDQSFLQKIQDENAEWRELRERIRTAPGQMLKPEIVARELGKRLADDAIIATDSGHNTGLCARYLDIKERQKFAVSGALASMACGLPYAIAAAIAFPGRQVVTMVGDGGLSMSLAELATCVRYRLPVKIVVIKNNILGQIKWEQMQFLGNPEFECDLQPIDFVRVAEAMGLRALQVDSEDSCGQALDDALAARGPVLVEAVVDPNEPLLPPKRNEKYVNNLTAALAKGTPGGQDIERALQEDPARSFLKA
jgi:pyruvate dehydrogenase (quinone)